MVTRGLCLRNRSQTSRDVVHAARLTTDHRQCCLVQFRGGNTFSVRVRPARQAVACRGRFVRHARAFAGKGRSNPGTMHAISGCPVSAVMLVTNSLSKRSPTSDTFGSADHASKCATKKPREGVFCLAEREGLIRKRRLVCSPRWGALKRVQTSCGCLSNFR